MIERTPPHGQLTPAEVAMGCWLAHGTDLVPGDVLVYWGVPLPILRWDGRRAICQGWERGFTIWPTDRWAILPRKEPVT